MTSIAEEVAYSDARTPAERAIDDLVKSELTTTKTKKTYKITERTPWGQKGEWVTEEDIPVSEDVLAERKAKWEAEEAEAKAKREASDLWMANTLEMDSGSNFVYSAEELIERFTEMYPEASKMTERKIAKLRQTYGRTAKESHTRGKRFVLAAGNPKRRQEYVVGADGAWRKVKNAV